MLSWSSNFNNPNFNFVTGCICSRVVCALQGVPAIAVSLDNYKALTPEGFMAGAAYVVALVKASKLLEFCADPVITHCS